MEMVNPSGTSQPMSIEQRLSAVLNPESGSEQPTREAQPEDTAQAEPVEMTERTEHDEPEPETLEADAGDTEDQDAEEVPTYTVKVNGEEMEVSIDDLRSGYMMETDYRKKTAELSEQRKAIEAKEAEIDAKLADADIVLQMTLEDMASDEVQRLKRIDPEAYLQKKEAAEKRVKKYESLKKARDERNKAKFEASLKEEIEKLKVAIPEWNETDPLYKEEVARKEQPEVFKFLADIGYSEGELVDHRLVVMARKAAMYDKIRHAKPESKRVNPKVTQSQPGTASSKVDRQRAALQKQRESLRKGGGKFQDAAAILKSII